MTESVTSYSIQIDNLITEGMCNNFSLTEIKKLINERLKIAKDIDNRTNPRKKPKKNSKYLRPAMWISDSSDNES
jgi:hypothetical protein